MWSGERYSVCLAVSCLCASLGSPLVNNFAKTRTTRTTRITRITGTLRTTTTIMMTTAMAYSGPDLGASTSYPLTLRCNEVKSRCPRSQSVRPQTQIVKRPLLRTLFLPRPVGSWHCLLPNLSRETHNRQCICAICICVKNVRCTQQTRRMRDHVEPLIFSVGVERPSTLLRRRKKRPEWRSSSYHVYSILF